MKYIIVRGSRSAGKAETISEVCKRLNPENIWKIHISETGQMHKHSIQNDVSTGIYVLSVRKKNVLIVSGAPTEQGASITAIIETVSKLEFEIDFAIVSMRALEKLKGFSTAKELENFGKCIYHIKIWRIPSHYYKLTEEWNKRITYLTTIALNHL